jgi:hypothetical protein
MQRSHSCRYLRREFRTEEQFTPRGCGAACDPADKQELDRLIAAKCKTPRTEFAATREARLETAGETRDRARAVKALFYVAERFNLRTSR